MRLVRIDVSTELLTQLLTAGYQPNSGCVCTLGLPPGAVVVCSGNPSFHTVSLYFNHPSFPDVDWPEEAPLVSPQYGVFTEPDLANEAAKKAKVFQFDDADTPTVVG